LIQYAARNGAPLKWNSPERTIPELEHTMTAVTKEQIVPNSEMTFTIATVPTRPAAKKTIERLMWMQTEKKRDLKMLQRRRKQKVIKHTIRAGRVWLDRPRATRTARCELGASFSVRVTPQIMNDLKSVAKYLDA
jgi:hypothetical protein